MLLQSVKELRALRRIECDVSICEEGFEVREVPKGRGKRLICRRGLTLSPSTPKRLYLEMRKRGGHKGP